MQSNKFALVCNGGGVKGIAFVGAYSILTKYFVFDTFLGTSAGAIFTSLVATEYNCDELTNILNDKDIGKLIKQNIVKQIYNLIFHKGLNDGVKLRKWLDELYKDKTKKEKVNLIDIKQRLIIVASNVDKYGKVTFDSEDKEKNQGIELSLAVRMSLSIPFIFTPIKLNEDIVVDGGLLSNFPLEICRKLFPEKQFIGLYLDSNEEKKGLLSKIINTVIKRDDQDHLDKEKSIVKIDTSLVSSTKFSLSQTEKSYLFLAGKKSTFEFLKTTKILSSQEEEDYNELCKKYEEASRKLKEKQKNRKRLISFIAILLGVSLLSYFIYSKIKNDINYKLENKEVDEVKFIPNQTSLINLEKSMRNGAITKLLNYECIKCKMDSISELQIYYDDESYTLIDDKIHFFVKIVFDQQTQFATKVSFILTRKTVGNSDKAKTWSRFQKEFPIPLKIDKNSFTLASLINYTNSAVLNLSPDLVKYLRRSISLPETLSPKIVLGIKRKYIDFYDKEKGNLYKSYFNINDHLALYSTEVNASKLDTASTLKNSPVYLLTHSHFGVFWKEIELEETFYGDFQYKFIDIPLKLRLNNFSKSYDLDYTTDSIDEMPKIRKALKYLKEQ
jgi:predicted acylesterase/phospholipase RssA